MTKHKDTGPESTPDIRSTTLLMFCPKYRRKIFDESQIEQVTNSATEILAIEDREFDQELDVYVCVQKIPQDQRISVEGNGFYVSMISDRNTKEEIRRFD